MLRALSVFITVLILHNAAFGSGPIWEPGGTKCLPNFRNDKAVGYICLKVEPGSVYQKTGLQKGDNVTAINGKSVVNALNSPDGVQKVIDLWNDFEKQEASTLVVERGDNTLTLKKPTK